MMEIIVRQIGKLFPGIIISLAALAVLSCHDDSFNSAMVLENLPIHALLMEQADIPVPGNDGIITFASITDTAVNLIWSPAIDGKTPEDELSYKVVRSMSNNISTPEKADLNGTIITDWTPAITGTGSWGLIPGETYYFNVIVRDGDGLMAAYMTVSATTTAVNAVYLFSAGQHQGDFACSGTFSSMAVVLVVVPIRDMADSFCSNAKDTYYPALACSNVRAFISISSADSIADMPLNHSVPNTWEIRSVTGMIVASNWADLMDGTIDDQLQNLGVADDFWWSGSDTDGTAAADNCDSWSTGTIEAQGVMGAHNRTSDQWLHWSSTNCNTSRHVLCLCW